MLSVLAYKLRSKCVVVKIVTTDPDVIHISLNGGNVLVTLPSRQTTEKDTPILAPLGFTD